MAERKKKQQSSIDRLPDDIREQLQELLRDPRVTQLQATEKINAVLEADGHEGRISKSAVNRYDLQMREVGQRLQQSREVAEMWIAKLGAAPQGKIGNLVNEILRSLSFDLSLTAADMKLDAENMPAVAGMLKDLALTTMRLEKAANLNVEREKEIRQQALAEAAKAVGDEASAQGMTAEQADFWRRKVLGVN
ncbi:DUF3486 family protein [uncultured Desulfuromonas sp.]|uniref:DUF3486 family protein n=1 Tax=uncultured Desulfuromonas sp. TaxID=181013 RepID=UPI002AAA6518|nr:DUF3486 family protein [uncultured Desulfuromonas sp.]